MNQQKNILENLQTLSLLERSLIRASLYFAIFRYPLRAEEIYRNCSSKDSNVEEVRITLDRLCQKGLMVQEKGFYYPGAIDGLVERRLKGNQLAAKREKKARRVARRIAKFPFVRAVMVSGSLSKGYMASDSDLDFFVVTEPGRLWVARTALIFYKKLFLLNSHKNFCVNYFIDTAHLEVEHQNPFTATETVTLLPMVNPNLYRKFRQNNGWADVYYPNFGLREEEKIADLGEYRIKRRLEKWLGGKRGEQLDTWCLRRTMQRWDQKFPHFDAETKDVAMRSRRYVSKHHPQNFQRKVLNAWYTGIIEFENRHGVKL